MAKKQFRASKTLFGRKIIKNFNQSTKHLS